MKKEHPYETKPSEPDKVDAYMKKLKHPLTAVVAALRRIILSTGQRGKAVAIAMFPKDGDA